MSVAPSTPSASAPSIKHVPNEEGLLFMSLGLDKNFEPVAYLNIVSGFFLRYNGIYDLIWYLMISDDCLF